MNQQQYQLHQMMDQGMMMDFAFRSVSTCWATCFDSNINGAALAQGAILEETPKQMQCQKRCMDRFFEIYSFLGETREKREQEAQMQMMGGAGPFGGH